MAESISMSITIIPRIGGSIAYHEGLAMDELVLQRGEEALRACIVVAIAVTAHAGQQAIRDH